jgi:hypothetical protein
MIYGRNKKGGLAPANKAARAIVSAHWGEREMRWSIAPGKEVISRLSGWAQDQFGVSFGPEQLAREIAPDELAGELRDVLEAIPSARRLKPEDRFNDS